MNHEFIVSGPQKNDVIATKLVSNMEMNIISQISPHNSQELGIRDFLNQRGNDAEKYANKIVKSNLNLWLAAKLDDNISPFGSRFNSPANSNSNNKIMIQQRGIQPYNHNNNNTAIHKIKAGRIGTHSSPII